MFPLLVVGFIVVPIVEIFVIIRVGTWIGLWPTVALLLLDGLVGAWLFKREGRRTWTAFRSALQAGRFPAKEVADGALVLVGGTLLLAPGFVTDVVGAFMILPPTRGLARRLLIRMLPGRFGLISVLADTDLGARRGPRGDVIDSEVVRPPTEPQPGHGPGEQ